MSTRQQYRTMRTAIRRLKRDWPTGIVLYKVLSQTTDPKIGVVVKTWKRLPVKRVMVLPASEMRSFVYDLSFIAANKNFTMGGAFDTADRTFLIDRDDLKGIVITNHDYITHENTRWDISSAKVSAELRFVTVTCKSIEGMLTGDTWPLEGSDVMEVSENDA